MAGCGGRAGTFQQPAVEGANPRGHRRLLSLGADGDVLPDADLRAVPEAALPGQGPPLRRTPAVRPAHQCLRLRHVHLHGRLSHRPAQLCLVAVADRLPALGDAARLRTGPLRHVLALVAADVRLCVDDGGGADADRDGRRAYRRIVAIVTTRPAAATV